MKGQNLYNLTVEGKNTQHILKLKGLPTWLYIRCANNWIFFLTHKYKSDTSDPTDNK